jgi:GntR family transcriptional regulator
MLINTLGTQGGDTMFELDFRSRIPIYEQMVARFKELVISSVLKPDEQLPSVRVLAGELTVNPNTVQKAYRELEHQGYIYSAPGKGHFVMPAVPGNHLARLNKLKQELARIVAELHYLGMSYQDISSVIEGLIPGLKGGQQDD